MAKKGGLGKGLDSLIPEKKESKAKAEETKTAESGSPMLVDINKVEPDRLQPRKNFDEDQLIELSDSIKQYGVLTPLLVHNMGDYYEIVAGERRWRAAKMAGLTEVPVIIREMTDQEKVEISLIENIQRADLNPIEEALAYKRLIVEFDLKQDEVAERVSKARTSITNSLRLLKLDERVQQMVIEDLIPPGSARAILGIQDGDQQYEFAKRILDEKMSVRDVEKAIKKLTEEKKEKESKEIDAQLRRIYEDIQEQLKNIMGTKVVINAKDSNKGKLEIEYYSQDELNRIVEMLQNAR